jgi:LAO/AO transport system kinase
MDNLNCQRHVSDLVEPRWTSPAEDGKDQTASNTVRLNVQPYIDGVLARDERVIARAISEVENGTPAGKTILMALRPHAGRGWVVGITGPPGAGKSTLVGSLIAEFRRRRLRVAVIAIDPSSSISGGAVLGDRVRMDRHTEADGVYIRSLASRGHPGALCRAAAQVVDILDAAGFDRIIVETVGAGQSDVDAAELSGTLIVVCPPGLGDEVQAIKAGIMEVADIYVVSKGDLPSAEKTERDLLYMLGMRGAAEWSPPVVRVVASRDEGIARLTELIESHAQWKATSGGVNMRARIRKLLAVDAAEIVRQWISAAESDAIDGLCDAVLRGEVSDAEAAQHAIALTTCCQV